MTKIAEHHVPRRRLYLIIILMGLPCGAANAFLDVDLTLRPALFGWFGAAILAVVLLHEGVHGAVAAVFGHKPLFGVRLPFVYVTFARKIPRGQFMMIALAPLIVLDLLFGALYATGILKLLSNLCFMINTLGAAGDVWISLKLIPYERGILVQDTKDGVEVWQP